MTSKLPEVEPVFRVEVQKAGSADRSKTIVVTGGAGFLGSHLCDILMRDGHNVICVDNLLSGRMANISHLIPYERFEFIFHDIVEPLEIDGGIDEIYNLACPASPDFYQRTPIETLKACVIGSLNMLELARQKRARILQASTSEVYGDPETSPQAENYRGSVNSVGPRACYDEGKRAAETLFYDFHRKYGVVTKIARIFNTYGPNMRPDDGRVVSNFVVQALQNSSITVYGDGTQTRSFCYRDDLVDGLVRLMASGPEVCNPVNVGNPEEFTILELAEMVLDMTGSSSRIRFEKLPTDDPRQRRPDINAAKELLNWSPTVSLEEGLAHTIEAFRHTTESLAAQ